MPIRADALVVMAKAPIPGTVKTRLMPLLTADQAAELARGLLLDQIEHLCAFAEADLHLAYAPSSARGLIRQLAPPRFAIFPQSEGDLGARMRHIFATLFAKRYQRIVLIGADLPPVPLEYFTAAFSCLRRNVPGAVLGPADDGGYYLIGLNQHQPALFEQINWSHDQVLAQTVAKVASLGVPIAQIPGWFDVDTVEDLQRVVLFEKSHPSEMKHTLQILARLPVGHRVSDNLDR
jgi:rSAM/selenodomain-associated transferase 1